MNKMVQSNENSTMSGLVDTEYVALRDAQIEHNAFYKGIKLIYERNRRQAAECRQRISEALKNGGLSRKALHNRMMGEVNHSEAEREKIQRIFSQSYGVKEPWGF